MVRTFLKVYLEFGSYLFLQEQIKDIIITRRFVTQLPCIHHFLPKAKKISLSPGPLSLFPLLPRTHGGSTSGFEEGSEVRALEDQSKVHEPGPGAPT